jgi:tetratricopeptide (TPR) repeat protein
MKRITPISLCLLLGLALVIPAFGQGGENAAWQAIDDEKNTRRQADLLVDFISRYSSSPHRPDADKMLVNFWVSNKDNAKIVNHADTFKQSLPSADNQSKSIIYTQAMVAAATLNNVKKTTEFGDLALAADSKNFMVLAFLASSGVVDQKTAIDYARRASELPQPRTMAPQQYQSLMTRVKNLVASANAPAAGAGPSPLAKSAQDLMVQKKYPEALEIYAKVVEQNPKDALIHYQVALAHYYIMADAAQNVQQANDEQIKAMIATPTVQADIDKAAAKKEQFTKLTLEKRDAAIDALAKTLAIIATNADAKRLFDALYQSKKGSLEGQDLLIAEKKKELGL